jgi:hypothetical protein
MTRIVKRAKFAVGGLFGPLGGLLVLGLDLAMEFTRRSPFLGDPLFTERWFALSLLYFCPVLSGLAATDAARISKVGNAHWARASHGRRYWWAWSWTVIPAVVIHVLAVVGGLVAGRTVEAHGRWADVAVGLLVQCAEMAWFAAIGSVIGRALSPVFAGVAGVVGGFAIYQVLGDSLSATDKFHLVGDSGASVSQLGLRLNMGHLGAQLFLYVVTGALMMCAAVIVRRGATRLTSHGCAAVAAACVIALVVPLAVPGRFNLPAPIPTDRCAGAALPVCYYQVHARYAGPIVARIQTAARVLTANGYGAVLPTRAVEGTAAADTASLDAGEAVLPVLDQDAVDAPSGALFALAAPVWCPWLHDESKPPPGTYWADLTALQNVIAAAAGGSAAFAKARASLIAPTAAAGIVGRWARCSLD